MGFDLYLGRLASQWEMQAFRSPRALTPSLPLKMYVWASRVQKQPPKALAYSINNMFVSIHQLFTGSGAGALAVCGGSSVSPVSKVS